MKDWHALLLMLALYGAVVMAWYLARHSGGAGKRSAEKSVPGKLKKSVVMARNYNPSKVGNDSAARPWESLSDSFMAASTSAEENDEMTQEIAFIAQARDAFVTMQKAWDFGDIARLRTMMTEEMADTLRDRLLEREQQGASVQPAEIVVLEARFLGMEQTENQWIASVEFFGMVREAQTMAPTPFREIWDMTKSRNEDQPHWLVAGVESLQ